MSLSQNPFYDASKKQQLRDEATAETKGILDKQRFEEERKRKQHADLIRGTLTRFESDLKRAESKLSLLEGEIRTLEQGIEERETREAALARELKTGGKGTEEFGTRQTTTELETIKSEKEEIVRSIAETKQKGTERTRKSTQTKAEEAKLERELRADKGKEETEEVLVHDLGHDIQELERKLAEKETALKKEEKELYALQKEIVEEGRTLEELHQNISGEPTTRQALHELEATLAKAEIRERALRAKMTEQSKNVTTAQDEKRRIEEEIARLKQEQTTASRRLLERKRDEAELRRTVDALKGEVEDAKRELQNPLQRAA